MVFRLHECFSLASILKGWLDKMEMFTCCKVMLYNFFPSATARTALI